VNQLDERLSTYHRGLVASLASPAAYPADKPRRTSRRWRFAAATLLGVVAAVAVPLVVLHLVSGTPGRASVITVKVSGFTVVEEADTNGVTPRINRNQAASAALQWLASGEGGMPAIDGARIVTSSFRADVYSVTWADGSYSTTGPPENLWLITLEAPGQPGWQHTEAHVLVDGDTGDISGANQYSYNCPTAPASASPDYPACP
jgi:hypothetical protein